LLADHTPTAIASWLFVSVLGARNRPEHLDEARVEVVTAVAGEGDQILDDGSTVARGVSPYRVDRLVASVAKRW